jgi:hypothetical protein
MNKEKLDIDSTTSDKKGIEGFLETFIRKFRTLGFSLLMMPIAVLYIICMGISLVPGVMLFQYVYQTTLNFNFIFKSAALGFSIAAGFFLYGFTLIFIVPLVNKLLPWKVKPQRSTWFSLSVIPWYYHNALTYLARYTFLDIITPTPLNKLFYQLMGMKIGKGTMINTSNISDPCLIEIGDNVTIGGSCTLVAHYGMKGFLIIDKLVIKDRAVIGLRSNVFGDVVIGEGAVVKPNEVIYPKTRLPDVPKDEK